MLIKRFANDVRAGNKSNELKTTSYFLIAHANTIIMQFI